MVEYTTCDTRVIYIYIYLGLYCRTEYDMLFGSVTQLSFCNKRIHGSNL